MYYIALGVGGWGGVGRGAVNIFKREAISKSSYKVLPTPVVLLVIEIRLCGILVKHQEDFFTVIKMFTSIFLVSQPYMKFVWLFFFPFFQQLLGPLMLNMNYMLRILLHQGLIKKI